MSIKNLSPKPLIINCVVINVFLIVFLYNYEYMYINVGNFK